MLQFILCIKQKLFDPLQKQLNQLSSLVHEREQVVVVVVVDVLGSEVHLSDDPIDLSVATSAGIRPEIELERLRFVR